jgi:hypothetical protein
MSGPKIALDNGPYAMDKKLYVSKCCQLFSTNILYFMALQQALLGNVKWVANPTHTKPLHNKRPST